MFRAQEKHFRSILFPEPSVISILTGPFAGVLYLDETVWGPITPKWLGSYEVELTSIIEQIIVGHYDKVIDIGCAEGYYAVGLATRMPDSIIHAFDTDFISRRQLRKLALINNVTERVKINALCSHLLLKQLIEGKVVVICDIEGYESVLLDPDKTPALDKCDLLVEVHQTGENASTEDILRKRFSTTHTIQLVNNQDRGAWLASNQSLFPKALTPALAFDAVNEHRNNGNHWLWISRKMIPQEL